MYEYKALVLNVVDGDTLDVDVDLGLRIFTRCRLRLLGIDAPDRAPAKGAATDYLRSMLPVGSQTIVRTEKDRGDKYGRWLATVTTEAGVNVNQSMVDGGHAKPYDGGPRQP